ncbi:N-acetyltransferase family protein [Kribbella solani]|uniref:Phosphinothricin acetyltransferase n=1 Tax=Kribbella solani TaxID=236067 RepID=A0A841DNR3_9ACTN|nr:phosphinothricin acetyltransferase [Kribbella solani]
MGSPGELSAIAAIMSHYVRNTVVTFIESPPTVSDWAERYWDLAARGLPFLVAEADGDVVGFAYAAPWRPKSAYRHTVENSIYLSPAATGLGIGTALLERLIERSAAAGCRQLIAVIVDAGDPASAKLHRRHGFSDAGRLHAVGFKHGRWLDTMLLQRSLPEVCATQQADRSDRDGAPA